MMMMKPTCLALLAAAALAAPLGAAAHDVFYSFTLDGPSEAQPNASPGTGSATLKLNDHDFTMLLSVTFSGLTGTTTAAHIHCCTTTPGVSTAGVATQLPSFVDFPLGVTAGSYSRSFDLTQAASWNPAFVSANGGTTSGAFAALAAGLASGSAYLNIHTSTFGSGEIRGFAQPVPEPGTWALMLGGLAAVGWLRRGRA